MIHWIPMVMAAVTIQGARKRRSSALIRTKRNAHKDLPDKRAKVKAQRKQANRNKRR